MDKEFDKNLRLLKEQKEELIGLIKNITDIKEKTKIINLLVTIDENIKKITSNKNNEERLLYNNFEIFLTIMNIGIILMRI